MAKKKKPRKPKKSSPGDTSGQSRDEKFRAKISGQVAEETFKGKDGSKSSPFGAGTSLLQLSKRSNKR